MSRSALFATLECADEGGAKLSSRPNILAVRRQSGLNRPLLSEALLTQTVQTSPLPVSSLDAIARAFAEIAREAGAAIMHVYAKGCDAVSRMTVHR